MFQTDTHLKWCMEKAKKELSQGKKHRGLIQTPPNITKAKEHLDKAIHNFNAIDYFRDGGYSDWSGNAGFYALYHCMLAILAKHGYESRNQECTISAIQHLKNEGKINLDEKFIIALQQREIEEEKQETIIELREKLQYGVQTKTQNTIIDRLKEICVEC